MQLNWVSARVQTGADYKTGRSAYILELVECNRSAYTRYGLKAMRIERDLLGGHTTEHVMAGKDYAKPGTRAHKITRVENRSSSFGGRMVGVVLLFICAHR